MPRRPEAIAVTLPALEPAGDGRLERNGVYEALEFRGLDLGDQEARRVQFMESGLFNCRLDGAVLREARLVDCVLEGVQAGALDVADSWWRDVVVADCRFGALTAYSSTLDRVRVSGGKVDFLNLRDATVSELRFERCHVGELDLGGARVRRLSFAECRLDRLAVTGAKLEDADLTGAELTAVEGLEGLAGATISEEQLARLAPAMAAHLGLKVQP
jgi:uncharacterized protein YjbI with pentapeptide repeats